MVYMSVKTEKGEWKNGVSLEYETEKIELNHIFYSHCNDYHSRVTGFFTGYDAWGNRHQMAEVEEFLRRNLTEYLAQHGLARVANRPA